MAVRHPAQLRAPADGPGSAVPAVGGRCRGERGTGAGRAPRSGGRSHTGRTRTEQLGRDGAGESIRISDPVRRVTYVLNPQTKSGVVVTTRSGPAGTRIPTPSEQAVKAAKMAAERTNAAPSPAKTKPQAAVGDTTRVDSEAASTRSRRHSASFGRISRSRNRTGTLGASRAIPRPNSSSEST